MSFSLAPSRDGDVAGKQPTASTPAAVGPGHYEVGSSISSSVRIPHEPFASSTRRSDPVGRDVATTPGPGTYDTAARPVPEMAFNGLVRNSFITKADRFAASAATYSPGPGAYEAASSLRVAKPRRSAAAATMSPASLVIASHARATTSVPSIPRKEQSFGYEFDSQNRISSNRSASAYKYTGRGGDAPSAGDYSPQLSKSGMNAAPFSKSRSRRFNRRAKRLGADAYDLPGAFDHLNGAKATSRLSSSFASRVVRVEVPPSITGLVDATSGADVVVSTVAQTASTPGVGAYNLPGAFDRVALRAAARSGLAREKQHFGSSAVRFGDENFLAMRTPGPGQYAPLPGLAAQVLRSQRVPRSERGGQRSATPRAAAAAARQAADSRRLLKASKRSKTAPDTRSYNLDACTSMASQLRKKLASRNRGKGFGFGSSTAQRGRQAGSVGAGQHGVQLGTADAVSKLLQGGEEVRARATAAGGASSSGGQRRQRRGIHGGNELLFMGRGPSFPRKKVGAFLSKAPRFRWMDDDAPEVPMAPGPGQYDVATSLLREGAHVSLKGQYDSAAVRFGTKGKGGGRDMPGPGSYNSTSSMKKGGAAITRSLRFSAKNPAAGVPGPG